MKWCPECGKWGDYLQSGYPVADSGEEGSGEAANVATGDNAAVEDNLVVHEDDEVSDGAFDRLRMAGLF